MVCHTKTIRLLECKNELRNKTLTVLGLGFLSSSVFFRVDLPQHGMNQIYMSPNTSCMSVRLLIMY